MTSSRCHLPSHTAAQFIAAAADHGVKRPGALELYRQGYRQGVAGAAWVRVDTAPIVREHREAETVKFVQKLGDGQTIESVIIPGTGSGGAARNTLCVSSQVGCAMGCTFCETAQMGLRRNLHPGEIVGQWFAARHGLGQIVSNVVFMGMGEPLDNLDAVIHAIRILSDDNGPGIAPARITVSTVGRIEGIHQLAQLAREPGFGKLKLAVSVNAPGDRVRSEIMPVNRAWPMSRLREAMVSWPGDRVLIEYVLIPTVNDALEHADALCQYLGDLPCTINVIPYNPRRNSPWPAPDEASVDRFAARVAGNGHRVKRRQTKGRSVLAACGQLGGGCSAVGCVQRTTNPSLLPLGRDA